MKPRVIDFGKSCGDISPKELKDACCARRNVNTIHIQCVGTWVFIPGKERGSSDECQFVCS